MQEPTSTASTEILRAISGSAAVVAVWSGSTSALDAIKRYRHDRRDPRSLISNNVYTIYGDRSGQMWVGLEGGISRFDPATDGFVNYRPVPENAASLANTVWVIYQDRSGALWAGTWGGVLIRFDDKAKAFVSYAPDRGTREGSTAAVSTPSSKTGPGHCGWERSTDCTGTTAEAERSPATRKARACPAAAFDAFWKIDSAGSGSAPRRAYPGSILGGERSEITTCPTDCRATSSVPGVFRPRMGRSSSAAATGSTHSSPRTCGMTPTCRRS